MLAQVQTTSFSFASLAETQHYRFWKPRFVGAGFNLPKGTASGAPTIGIIRFA